MAAAVASRADSKRKYSWWWDSHISPKNSKWLQENLTDMDAKVKQMIKLIEEDADSFARRAEMYYKKRPELMKMVEEFYRAYRALAERYDHATGVISQAHQTMSEAFPNQVHFMMGDDMPTGPADGEARTPDMPSTRALFDPEELPKDALGISPPLPHAVKRNGAFTARPDTVSKKQLNGRARNGLDFHDAEEEDQNLQDIGKSEVRTRIPSDSEPMCKAEREILTLKNALAKLEAEKEAGLLQYQQSLERLSNLESEVSCAKEDSQEFSERASKAEAEVQTLKEALTKLEAERESSFLQYQQCLEKIAKLEYIISHAERGAGELTERASKVEAEAQSLRQGLAKLETEKGDALLQYKQCLEKISALENKLLQAEDNAVMFKERADRAGREVEILKQAITKLTEEQEAAVVQYQQCWDTISVLEHKLTSAQEEAQRLNSEIDNGLVNLKGAEEKCLLLEKSNHIMHSELESLSQKTAALVSEEDKLVSQLQITTDNLEKLEEKNNFLESSLLDANAEIEGLRIKSKSLQDAYVLLENENAEKGNLVYELDNAKKRLAEMEKERQSSLHEIEELRTHLDAQKQEYACLVQLSKSRLAGMETKIRLLQEEGQRIKKEYEEEQLNREFSAETEIFVLQQCVQDLEENNFSVLLEFQKLLEASQLSEKLISELEQENLEQQIEVKSLYDQIKVLRMGLYRVLKTLEVDSNQWYQGKGGQDQMLLNLTLVKLQAMQKMVSGLQDEKQQLLIENSVFVTLLGQLEREVNDLVSAKNSLDQELACRFEQYFVLQTDNRKLSEMNEVLSLKIMEGDQKEEVLKVELSNLQGELSNLHSDSRKLSEMNEVLSLKMKEGDHKEEVLKVELNNLQVELLDLQGAYKALQEESRKMLDEEKTLKNFISELREEKSSQEEESCAIFAERTSLGILSLILRDIISGKILEIEELSKNHDKLCSVNDDLNVKVKVMEEKLMEFSAIQDEKSELHKIVGHLERKCDEVERKGADEEKQILKLSSDYDEQRKALQCIREANLKLESQLQLLNEELAEAKSKEEILNSEMQGQRDEIEHWESQAAALYGDLQVYVVHQALFEGKIHELIEACKSLEGRNCSKDLEIEQLKERIGPLESENEELKTQMLSCNPEFIALSDSITSLENHTLSHASLHEVDKEAKDVRLARHAESFQKVSKEQGVMRTGKNLGLQTMQMRIRAIKEAVMERERALISEISNANSKLGAAIGQLEELKSRKGKQESRSSDSAMLGVEKSKSVKEAMTKDIMLDQISECSSYGISRRETLEGDDHMLEIWETTEQDSSIDLTVGKAHKTEKKHRAHPSRESMLEKDVSVDKLEISRSKQEVSERKVLQRLDSDAQKLINLQITVQDLKSKVEMTEKNKNGNDIDHHNVKEQLEESEETITKLSDANRRLMKSIQDESFSCDESDSVRKISEQVRLGSEKIGRLQMELKKLQFLLLALDDEKKSRGKAKIIERKTNVLLRDYLYGGTRTVQKQKRRHFCACVQPQTKGD